MGPAESWRDELLRSRPVRPVRDALICIPAATYLAFLVYDTMSFALEMSAELLVHGNYGRAVAFAVMSFVGGLVGGSLVMAPLGLVWAAWVAFTSWIAAPKHSLLELAPAPFPSVLGRRSRALVERLSAIIAWLAEHRLKLGLAAIGSLLAIELVAELLSPRSIFESEEPLEIAMMLGVVVGAQVLGAAIIGFPLVVVLAVWGAVLKRLYLLARWWSRQTDVRRAHDLDAARDELTSRRGVAEGIAGVLERATLTAPLSGAPCLAVRVCGRTQGALVDDAEASTFVVHGEQEDIVVRAERFVVALPDPVRTESPDAAARARIAAFLGARGLPDDAEVELAETLLVPGQRVIVHGADRDEVDPRSRVMDYRTVRRRRVLDDSDGQPVLIELAGDR